MGFSIINPPFWGFPISGNPHIYIYIVTMIIITVIMIIIIVIMMIILK